MSSFRGGAELRVDKTKLYMVLGVSFSADEAAIKAAYKKLALRHHPDRHSGKSPNTKEFAEAKFQEVSAAYEVLGDAAKRAAYDSHGMPGVEALERSPEDATSGNSSSSSSGSSSSSSSSSNSSNSSSFSWDDPAAAAEYAKFKAAEQASNRRRAAAFATFAAAFGHGYAVPPEETNGSSSSSSSSSSKPSASITGAASEAPDAYYAASTALPVHNMASQRGGSSFDDLQRRRLDEAFADLDLGRGVAIQKVTSKKDGDG